MGSNKIRGIMCRIRLENLLKQDRAFETLKNINLSCRNKLQLLEEIDIPTANSFDGFSGYGFLSLTSLYLNSWDGDITELDFQYFPLLFHLYIYDSNIISIPQSISGLARLESIHIENCKRLREIPTLPQSVREVFVKECPSVDPQSFSRLLIQFGEILGILRNRFHEGARSNISMDPFHDSESESEDEYKIFWVLRLPVTEIPKDLKFSHQTFGNSVSFWVGKNFSKAVICIALGTLEAHMSSDYSVNISINGCVQQCLYKGWSEEKLWLFPIYLGQLDKLSEQNHIIVEGEYWIENPNEGSSIFELEYGTDLIKWIGVNVECSCYPKNSDVPCLPRPCAMNESGALNLGDGALLLFNLFFIFQTTHNYDFREYPGRHSGPFFGCLASLEHNHVPSKLTFIVLKQLKTSVVDRSTLQVGIITCSLILGSNKLPGQLHHLRRRNVALYSEKMWSSCYNGQYLCSGHQGITLLHLKSIFPQLKVSWQYST
nr:hypothetical protein CFP56_36107 [Quercus suber]